MSNSLSLKKSRITTIIVCLIIISSISIGFKFSHVDFTDPPISEDTYVYVLGAFSIINGANLSTSSKRDISECSLHATSPQMFSSAEYLRWMELAKSVSFHHYGSESYSYCLLAAGHMELVVEADLKICDFLPVVKLIQGSGGIITDWNGNPLTIESDGHVLASASQSIHNQAIEILRSN